MRHSVRLALTALTLLSLAAADALQAQRRTSGGSGGSSGGSSSGGSSSPSRGGGSGSGGSSSGGGATRDRGGSSGGSVSRPASAPSSRGGNDDAAPARTTRDRDGGSRTSRPDASATGSGRSGTSSASGRAGDGRATTGKIGSVRRNAQASRRGGGKVFVGGPVFVGGCYSCDYWGWYGGRWGWYGGGWWYPAPHYPDAGHGRDDDGGDDTAYDDYPYASNEEGNTFVRSRARNRGYGTLTAQYFSDFGSDVSAGRLGIEGAVGRLRLDADYAHYAEPVTAGTDRMQTFRAGLGFQPRLGDRAYAVVGIGGRGLWINRGGGSAGGPEGTAGLQVFPFKPFGMNVTGRLAGMRWSDGGGDFTLTELTTTGSVFVGRAEIQGGWHWLKIEGAPAFGGPVVGVRMWF